VEQVLYHVSKDRKMSLLLGILKREHPENALIFTNMKRTAEEVAKRLELNGYRACYIIGDLPQKKRLRVLEGLREGTVPYLVATDVAARGLHIEDLDMVVNYDLPEDREIYVHRIGRTARAGKAGKAVSLVCETYVYGLQAIESFTNEKIPVGRLDESLFESDKSAGVRIHRDYRGPSRRGSGSGRDRGSRDSRRRPPSRSRSGSSHGWHRSRRPRPSGKPQPSRQP